MNRARPVSVQSHEMQRGPVTLVLAEAVIRETRAEIPHQRVARDLGDDAGGGDAEAEAIAIDDGGLREGKRVNWEAIDERVIGRPAESDERRGAWRGGWRGGC